MVNQVMEIASLENCFVTWAELQDDLRAAFIVGSQARRDHPADQFSDLDIIMLIRDVEVRYHDASWLEEIAPLWISQMGHTISGEPERLALFAGGMQVDFVFHPVSDVTTFQQMVAEGELPDTIHRGVRVLFDKDGLLPSLPEPTPIPAAQPPAEMEFRQTLDSFWFSAVYCAKQLRRGELWLFQNASGGMIWPLLQIIEWQARADFGWDYDTWHAGKFIAEWADPVIYVTLQQVFAHMQAEDGWRAMQVRLDLFHTTARKLSHALGYAYPDELEQHIVTCIQEIRQSPKTATEHPGGS
jgi:aminoglycoside 6-adenylyltransferase